MILWHKSTESAKGSGLVVVKNGKNVGVMTAYEHRSQAPAGKWCYLTELLKLQEKLGIAVQAMKLARDTAYSSTQDCPKCAFIDEKLSEATAKIKEQD